MEKYKILIPDRKKDPFNDNDNRKLCEAFDCYEYATNEIEVQVGKLGLIKLNICNYCISKFTEPPEKQG
jgi:hypothetical protein